MRCQLAFISSWVYVLSVLSIQFPRMETEINETILEDEADSSLRSKLHHANPPGKILKHLFKNTNSPFTLAFLSGPARLKGVV